MILAGVPRRRAFVHRLSGSVALRRWWLATTSRWRTTAHFTRDPCTVRPNLSSAVGSEDKDKRTDFGAATATFNRPGSLVFGLCAL